jgi:drug/metabolite transporter, DME family
MIAIRGGTVEPAAAAGLVLVSTAAALWGTVGVASSALPDSIPPLYMGLARLGVAAPLLVLFGTVVLGRRLLMMTGHVALGIGGFGALMAVYQLCLFFSMGQLGVTTTTLSTVCLPPLMVALGSAVVLREWPSTCTVLALSLAIVGLLLVVGSPGAAEAVVHGDPLVGLLAALIAACAFATLSVLARVLARHTHPLQAVAFGFALGTAVLAAVAALGRGGEPALDPGHGSMLLVIVLLVYLGAGPTALSYLCYTYGMRLSRSVTSGVAATMIEPAVAVLLAAVLLGEQLAPTAWLGAACLPAASVLLGLDGRRSKPASPGNPLPVPPIRAEGKGSVVSIDCLVTTGRESAI